MTISNTNKFNRPAITTGTSINISSLELQDEDEVKITRQNADGTEAILVITTDYTVNTDLDTVTLIVAIDGVIFVKATATLDMVFTQEEDYENFDDFNVQNVENALDKARLIDKQGAEAEDRNIRFIISSAITDLEVDDPTGEGDNFMKLKSDLSGFEFTKLSTTAGLGNVVEDTTPQSGGNYDNNSFNQDFDDNTGIRDDSGNEQLIFQKTASAVNHIEITNAATGNEPKLSATGSDTDVDLELEAKGAGVIKADGLEVATASSTHTFTNKTIDADGTGNVITNIGSSEIKSELITGQSDVTIVAGDSIIYSDTSDSDNLKKDTVQGILDLVTSSTIVQVVNTQSSAVATGTTIMPFDDTINQNTEGDEYLTLAITPTNSSNILEFTVVVQLAHTAISSLSISLFQDSTANALATGVEIGALANAPQPVPLNFRVAAGTTSSTTFKIRAGGDNAGTTTVNGVSGSRRGGGVLYSSLIIKEIKV